MKKGSLGCLFLWVVVGGEVLDFAGKEVESGYSYLRFEVAESRGVESKKRPTLF